MQSGEDENDIGYAMVSCSQPRDKLGVGRSEDVEMPTIVWQADNDKAEKGEGGGWKGLEVDNGGYGKRGGSDGGQAEGRGYGS